MLLFGSKAFVYSWTTFLIAQEPFLRQQNQLGCSTKTALVWNEKLAMSSSWRCLKDKRGLAELWNLKRTHGQRGDPSPLDFHTDTHNSRTQQYSYRYLLWEKLCTLSLNLFNLFLIWASGGRQGKMPVTAFEAFDLEMKSWSRYPCIPSRRAFSSCAATEHAFYSLGGLQQPGPHNFYSRPHFVSTVEEYDSEQGEACSLPHTYILYKHALCQHCGKEELEAVY